MESYDVIDGKKVPGTVINSDEVLTGTHRGSIRVVGCNLRILGVVQGSVSLAEGAIVELDGEIQGSTSISGTSHLTIRGKLQGSASISSESKIVVESTGRLSGSLHNEGLLIIRGVFGGSYSGNGVHRLEEEGYIKKARIVNGVHYYDW
jgi:cytoskeletal protein CcmA (bactofilin family)